MTCHGVWAIFAYLGLVVALFTFAVLAVIFYVAFFGPDPLFRQVEEFSRFTGRRGRE